MRERIIRWGVTWQAGYNRVREIRVQKPDSTYSNVEYIRFPHRTGGGTFCAGPAHGFLFRILVYQKFWFLLHPPLSRCLPQ
jgi:hypothetical protein